MEDQTKKIEPLQWNTFLLDAILDCMLKIIRVCIGFGLPQSVIGPETRTTHQSVVRPRPIAAWSPAFFPRFTPVAGSSHRLFVTFSFVLTEYSAYCGLIIRSSIETRVQISQTTKLECMVTHWLEFWLYPKPACLGAAVLARHPMRTDDTLRYKGEDSCDGHYSPPL